MPSQIEPISNPKSALGLSESIIDRLVGDESLLWPEARNLLADKTDSVRRGLFSALKRIYTNGGVVVPTVRELNMDEGIGVQIVDLENNSNPQDSFSLGVACDEMVDHPYVSIVRVEAPGGKIAIPISDPHIQMGTNAVPNPLEPSIEPGYPTYIDRNAQNHDLFLGAEVSIGGSRLDTRVEMDEYTQGVFLLMNRG